MAINDAEHYALLDTFESTYLKCKNNKPAREPKDLWAKGYIYCNGEINTAFIAFRAGYALGKFAGHDGLTP